MMNTGTLTIKESTFRDNNATISGGAVNSAQAMLTIERSAFINNSATNGGAIFSSDFVASITNSTFSGNSGGVSGGGVEVQGGNMTIINSTIAGNTGGGIRRVGGGLKLRNSLIADNNGGDCSGGLSEIVNNYIEDGTCSPALSSADGSINLGSLTGSPAYYPLLSGSPAIDAAAAAHCPSLDQAGTTRPAGSGCDIGAYEKPPDPPTATDTETPTETATETVTPAATATRDPHAPQLLQIQVIEEETPGQKATPTDTATAIATDTATLSPIATDTATLTPSDTPTSTATATATLTPSPTASDTPMATDTATPTNTATLAPRAGCVNVGPGAFWLFPASNFLSGTVSLYNTDQCQATGSTTQAIGAEGYVYTSGGQAMAVAICAAAHGAGAYDASQQVFNADLWACRAIPPTATNTPVPTNTPTNTALPTNTATPTSSEVPPSATNTDVPATPADDRAIADVWLSSTAPGELVISWSATAPDSARLPRQLGQGRRSLPHLDRPLWQRLPHSA